MVMSSSILLFAQITCICSRIYLICERPRLPVFPGSLVVCWSNLVAVWGFFLTRALSYTSTIEERLMIELSGVIFSWDSVLTIAF